jgi:hypothetical protein
MNTEYGAHPTSNLVAKSAFSLEILLITKFIVTEVQYFTYFTVLGVLVGKPEGKRPLEGPTCRWEDKIKMYFQEILWGVD